MQTAMLNNGTEVLASTDRAGYFGAQTFANWTQARSAAEKARSAGFPNAHTYRGLGRAIFVAVGERQS